MGPANFFGLFRASLWFLAVVWVTSGTSYAEFDVDFCGVIYRTLPAASNSLLTELFIIQVQESTLPDEPQNFCSILLDLAIILGIGMKTVLVQFSML